MLTILGLNLKGQGLLKFYPQQANDLLKMNLFASFKGDGFLRFESRAISNFLILRHVILKWQPRKLSPIFKGNFSYDISFFCWAV